MSAPMIFESEKARKHLLKYGVVFSFRKNRRKHIGKGWITDRRGGRKLADIFITEVEEIKPSQLGEYVGSSGFLTYYDWIDEIKRLNRGTLPESGWLYCVMTEPKDDE